MANHLPRLEGAGIMTTMNHRLLLSRLFQMATTKRGRGAAVRAFTLTGAPATRSSAPRHCQAPLFATTKSTLLGTSKHLLLSHPHTLRGQ